MKKILFSVPVLMLAWATFAGIPFSVNEKVLEAFKQTFKDPQEVAWFENTGGYEVYFKCDGIDSRVWYDTEGNIVRTHRYYGELRLPPYVLGKLKKKYSDKTVFGVTEITDDSGMYYYIKLEDEKNWITIKAAPQGFLEVYEKFRKA